MDIHSDASSHDVFNVNGGNVNNDDDDDDDGDDCGSSLSSTFSGSGGTWSVPRSRAANGGLTSSSYRSSSGPRRSGSSFRVSLKPSRQNRRRHHHHVMSEDYYYNDDYIGSNNSETVWSVLVGWWDCCVHNRRSMKLKTMKQALCLLMGLAIIVTTHQVAVGPPISGYEYDPVDGNMPLVVDADPTTVSSTEDLVAQGEMAAVTTEELLDAHSIKTEEQKRDDFYEGVFNQPNTESFDENNNNWEPPGSPKSMEASLRGSTLKIIPEDEVLQININNTRFGQQQGQQEGEDEVQIEEEPPRPDEAKRTDWGPARQAPKPLNMVGYVLPIFTCYSTLEANRKILLKAFNEPSSDRELHDAALMLEASIHQNSIRTPESNSSYDYEMIALIHRSVESCPGGTNRTAMLQNLGYRVEVVREPIHASNVQNEYLQKHAPRNMGQRVGMKDLIRLFAFKLEEYPLVVLVDTSTWILHPPDGIFDLLLNGPQQWSRENPKHFVLDTFYPNGTISSQPNLPTDIDILFTRDYSSLRQNDWTTGMSLEFVPLKPSVRTFNRLINTYQTVPYDKAYGWEHKGYSNYAGSMLTKGLLTYYFSERQPHKKLELYRCIYNNMADVPFIAGRKGSQDHCRDVKEHQLLPDGSPMPCTDCRLQLWDEIVVINYAMCHVPWMCPYTPDMPNLPLLGPTLQICRKFHASWFGLRKAIEETFLLEKERAKSTGTFRPEVFHGYCLPGGSMGGMYTPMKTASFPNGLESHQVTTT